MKIVSVALLMVLGLSTLFSIVVIQDDRPEQESFFTLNVCHTHSSSVLNNPEMPFIYECPCKDIVIAFAGFNEISDIPFKLPVISIQKDFPPEV